MSNDQGSQFLRAPIVVVLGHVDAGKTTLLDKIRGTAVAKREPGTMTQHIGASFLPWKALEAVCGSLVSQIRAEVVIPGFLVIDTPGHEAFSNLRRRGGSIADIAILVVDVLRGLEQQTFESIDILRERKVPFIVAVNKIDKIPGWKSFPNTPFVESVKRQSEAAQLKLEELLSYIIQQFASLGFRSDRYDRIRDFTRVLALVPVSAVTGEGIPDLLLVLAGLAQRYLKGRLLASIAPGKGVILELKEEAGLGMTATLILYDGVIRRGDIVVTGGIEGAFSTRVRALLMPKPLDEMRSPEDRFLEVERIVAAAGVKLVAEGLEKAVPGAPLFVAVSEEEVGRLKQLVEEEISGVKFERDVVGVVVKADTLGTLEALVGYLKKQGIPIRVADIGPVVKRDVVQASMVKEKDPLYAAILAFNVKILPEAQDEAARHGIPVFQERIMYKLVENYQKWLQETRDAEVRKAFEKITPPAVVQILPGYVFRRRDPIIVGVRVVCGRIRSGVPLITKDGREIGEIMQIKEHDKVLDVVSEGAEVAISIRSKAIVGRQVKEGDYLYSNLSIEEINRLLEKYEKYLAENEKSYLRKLMRFKMGLSKEIEYP
ncbi:translation initiation factor IF-2 [Thermofilum pendens]|uniref:Probable translation initiation factor IF-2 n=1 Tax=Thermofilum pendens (strain DSM 2475 / Hrk 5) TaxID=368408 RepID=IF2P_THEPD|nr:translation initiation factor IF-2 [Thermofilum pendens]A1RXH6.1 RecName: Full=Probable translation initiation factor IF-2 [Thermofilum pendens Hrk 5]ABL77906.1 translation initiation factor aIF-2 [Thermofilum pendens Hrk 5]